MTKLKVVNNKINFFPGSIHYSSLLKLTLFLSVYYKSCALEIVETYLETAIKNVTRMVFSFIAPDR